MEKMSTEENKWTKLINKLIELTQKNKLIWSYVKDDSIKEKPGDIINDYYTCAYKENDIRIISYNTLDFPSQPKPGVLSNLIDNFSGNKEWITRIKIEIGNNNEGWWEIPYTSNIGDLLDTIKFKASGAQTVINDLLSET